jgi:hypothetical protein
LVALLVNLANVCTKKVKLEEAERLNKRALAITEKVKGPYHYEAARSVNGLKFIVHFVTNFRPMYNLQETKKV